MKSIRIGDYVLIKNYGIRGTVTEYFDDSWIVVNARGADYNVRRDEIEMVPEAEKELYYPIVSEGALGLRFSAVKKLNGELNYYEVALFSNLPVDILFEYVFTVDGIIQYKIKKEIAARSEIRLHEFKTDQLNDGPDFSIECWLKKPVPGKQSEFQEQFRLKPKQFFNYIESEQFKSSGKFDLVFFKELPDEKETEIVRPSSDIKLKPENTKMNEVLSKVLFPDFIDLHAEKLIPDFERYDASEILALQLNKFRKYLDDAIRLNMETVFCVHGLGTGKLKSEIEKILRETNGVKSFENSYQPRFGFGATEIHLE